MTLTKKMLVKSIAKDVGCTHKKAADILVVLLQTIQQALAEKESISIRKFGKLYVKTQSPRWVTHPLTGRQFLTEQKNIAKFKPSKYFENCLNIFEWSSGNLVNKAILEQIYELIENAEIEDIDEDESMYYPGRR